MKSIQTWWVRCYFSLCHICLLMVDKVPLRVNIWCRRVDVSPALSLFLLLSCLTKKYQNAHKRTGFPPWLKRWWEKNFVLALTMTCCPSSSLSSVSRARFVTAGAIDLKLWTYVPLGEMSVQTKFRSDLILGFATRGPKPKRQKVLLLMAGSSQNFYHR
jgi:hypothetical protein